MQCISRYKSAFATSEKMSTILFQDRANEETEACVTVNMRCCTENDEHSESKNTSMSTTNRGPIPLS